MKKLIITLTAAICAVITNGMTDEEAFATKNLYVIHQHCKETNQKIDAFIFHKFNATGEDNLAILNSVTNFPTWCINLIRKPEAIPFYQYEKFYENSILSALRYEKLDRTSEQTKPIKKFMSDTVARDVITRGVNYDGIVKIAIMFDQMTLTTKYTDWINVQRFKNANAYDAVLILAVYKNDVDIIIECLKHIGNKITPEQAQSIIEPLNAVDANYRKDDILEVLNNINSWCTIKLYEDQETWEPILAKIRAMISVRK